MAAAVIKRLQEPFPHLLVGRRFSSLFRASILGYDWRRSANSKGNRSSPLYAICLNWITFLQCVGFDSKLFYGRHYPIEPDGEHPTSMERNSFNHLSMCPPNFALCASILYKFIVPMPSTINSTNFSSLVSTALFPESNRSGALSLPAESIERDIKPQ